MVEVPSWCCLTITAWYDRRRELQRALVWGEPVARGSPPVEGVAGVDLLTRAVDVLSLRTPAGVKSPWSGSK